MAMLRGRKVGFVFQSYHLLPTLTAEENVLLPFELTGGSGPEGRKRARELLESVGLLDRRDHYPVQLSGGEQQRVALARAFMVRPPILLADEPTGNLDPHTSAHVFHELLELIRHSGVAALIATHNLALAKRMHRVLVLDGGQLHEVAPASMPG
jgi:putative ABC transport system ATP-binding protein